MARNAVISLTYVVNVATFNEQKMVVYENSVYDWTNSAANLWIIDVPKMSNYVYVSNRYYQKSSLHIPRYKFLEPGALFHKQSLK